MQAEVERCHEMVRWCADSLRPENLRELRALHRPPAAVQSIFDATAILIGADKWQRKMLVGNFCDRLRNVNIDDVSLAQFRQVRKLLVLPDFDEEVIRGVCPPAVPLAVWCRAIGACLAKTRFGDGIEQMPDAEGHAAGDASGAGLVIEPALSKLSLKDLQHVTELTVSRPDVGSITFHGETDCSAIDLAKLVHLDVGEVLVYPNGFKPPVGQGLNKLSTVTMYQCWPTHSNMDPGAQERYRRKIQQMTEEKRAKFVDYNCSTGVWKFQVEHF